MNSIIKKYKNDIIIFIIPLIVLTVIFLAYYPGLATFDSYNQWNQVQSGIMTNSHPFFSTYFMYLLSKIWDNYSIVIFFQIFIFSFFWSIICHKLRNNNNLKHQIIYTTFISFIPIISLYSITLWKDILYSYYLMMLAFMTYEFAVKDKIETSRKEFAILGLLLFLVGSYRHNGIIVVGLYLLLLIIYCLIKNVRLFKNIIVLLLTLIVLFISISIPKNHYLSKSSRINSTKKNEYVLSILDKYITWIFGNYLSKNVVSNKDKKFLNNIMNTDYWKKSYNGYVINTTFLPDKINEKYVLTHETKYRNMFIKYTLKYPNLFIDHYSKSDGMLYSINSIDHKGYVYVFPFTTWDYYSFSGMIDSKLPIFEYIYTKIVGVTLKKPLMYLYQPGLILYITIICTIIVSIRKNIKKLYFILVPMILNTISLTPINLAQDLRYVYINYLTLLIIGLVYFSSNKAKLVDKNN